MAASNSATYGSTFWERVNNLFSKSSRPGDDLEEQPRHKGFLIAMCVLFSVLLWFFSSMGETYTKVIEMEARIDHIPENEAFTSLPPPRVLAQVEGEGLKLLQLYYKPPRIVIDASEGRVNLREAVLRQLPPGVVLERVNPSEITLQKEERIRRKVPVEPRVSISWPPTHDLVHPPIVYPDSVEVSGARSIVESLTDWPTVYFEKHDVRDTLVVMLPLADSLDGLVELGLREVQYTAVVEEFTEGSREVEVFVTEVPSNHHTVSLDPPFVEVFFRVPLSQYQQAMKARGFFASVSYDRIREDTTGFVAPHIELPEGILFRDVYVKPAEVRYYDLLIDE